MAATVTFSKTRVQKVLRAMTRQGWPWRPPLETIEREFGEAAGAFLWYVWREQAYDPTGDATLLERMAAATDSYDAREAIALLQRLRRNYDGQPALPQQPAAVLEKWCDPLDAMVVRAAREAPDALRAAWSDLRVMTVVRDGVALALAREGAMGRAELPAGLSDRLAAHGLLSAGQPEYERARAAVFADDAAYHRALLAAAETATVMSSVALLHLSQTTPPRVWVHVVYHVGAVDWAAAPTNPQIARLFAEVPDATRAEMAACADRMLGAPEEVSPFRLDLFGLDLALATLRAGQPVESRYDPLLVAALRTGARWDTGWERAREVVASLPEARAEALLVAAAGVLPGGVVRRHLLGARTLRCLSAVPTDKVLTAVLDVIATWDSDETLEKIEVALEAFADVGPKALPHVRDAERRHRDHHAIGLFRRLERRIDAVG